MIFYGICRFCCELLYAGLFLQNSDCIDNVKNGGMGDWEAIGFSVGFGVIDEPLLIGHTRGMFAMFIQRLIMS